VPKHFIPFKILAHSFFRKRVSSLTFIAIAIGILSNSCTKTVKENGITEIRLSTLTENLNFGDYQNAQISLIRSNGKIEFEDLTIRVKYRGNVSAWYPKKNFSIKADRNCCLIEDRCFRKWKINAEYIDKTFIRNKLSYDLFRAFSDDNFAPHIEYSILYLNNINQGIYALTDRVDEDRLDLKMKDHGSALFKAPPLNFPPEVHEERRLGMIEFFKRKEFYFNRSEKAFEELKREAYFNQRFPNIKIEDRTEIIYDLTEFIFHSSDLDFSDASIFERYFDLNSIIDWHLLLLLTNNGDGVKKNFYIYRENSETGFKFIPWDYDHSFGRDGDGEPHADSIRLELDRMELTHRLLDLNPFNYRQQLYNRYMELTTGGILTVGNINAMIDLEIEVLQPHMALNDSLWPMDSINYFSGSSFEDEIQIVKDFVGRRLPIVEEYLKRLSNE